MRNLTLVLAAVSGLFLVACQESAEPPGGAGGSAGVGSGGAAGTGSGGAAGGYLPSCDEDVSGVWDLVAARYGNVYPGVIQISPDAFAMSLTDDHGQIWTMTYARNDRVTWTRPDRTPHLISASNTTPGPEDLGIIPMQVGGSWTFQSATEKCSATVTTDSFAATCTASNGTSEVGGPDWPMALPRPTAGQPYSFTRTSTLASSFGVIGGTWQSSLSGGGGSCQMRFEGNSAKLSCNNVSRLGDSVQLTLGADCVGSGLTSNGYELSAHRR